MNSCPFSKASTGLCTITRGMPGMIPRTMSSSDRVGRRRHRHRVAVARQARWSSRSRGRRSASVAPGWERTRPLPSQTSFRRQQMRGSGSPTSMSMTRRPPNAGLDQHEPGRLGPHLADLGGVARSRAPTAARRGRDRPPRVRRRRRACPRSRRTSGRSRGSRRRPATAGLTGHRSPPARRSPRRTTRANSFSTVATPAARGVAHGPQRRPGGVEQRVDRGPERLRVGLDRRPRARTRRGRA